MAYDYNSRTDGWGAVLKKIIIADDNAILRHGMKNILTTKDVGYTVVGEASSFQVLRNILKEHYADVLILDISLPGGVSFEVLNEIKINYPDLPVIISSFYVEDHYGLRAFKAGALGYLNKKCNPEQLVLAIREVASGKRYFSSAILDMIFNDLKNKPISKLPHHDLSDRELYVLSMLGQGISLTQISIDLALSIKTVSTYRQRILKKMLMTNNAQIVKYVVAHGETIDALSL